MLQRKRQVNHALRTKLYYTAWMTTGGPVDLKSVNHFACLSSRAFNKS